MERQTGVNVLYLTVKKKWFDMIASGEKKEEYREIKPYWMQRLTFREWHKYEPLDFINVSAEYKTKGKFYDLVCFKNGYKKDSPVLWVYCNGIRIGTSKPEWSDNWRGDVFVIELGNVFKNRVVL